MEKQLREPDNWQDFETLCKKLWGEIWKCPEIIKHGTLGQDQVGVDLYGIPENEVESKSQKKYYGIQCKKKDIKKNNIITEDEIDKEIEKAKEFKPDLKKYYIATTAKKDKKIEEYVRNRNLESMDSGSFQIYIYFWEDIVQLIDENRNTHNWYVKNQGYKTDYKIDFTFDNDKKEITYKPKFLKIITEYKLKPKPEPEPELESTKKPNNNLVNNSFLSYLSINPAFGLNETFAKSRATFEVVEAKPSILSHLFGNEKNESSIDFCLRIKNSGKSTIENYKIYLEIFGSYNGISPYNIHFEKLISKPRDYWKKILDPINSVLVPNELSDFDEFDFYPLAEQYEIKIKWNLISRDYEDNGELLLKIEPEFIESLKTVFVETEAEVRTDSKIEEYFV